jgi:hypothetical protein
VAFTEVRLRDEIRMNFVPVIRVGVGDLKTLPACGNSGIVAAHGDSVCDWRFAHAEGVGLSADKP